MRMAVAVLTVALAGAASADCPPGGCFPGGGPAATDCFIEWAGLTGAATSCADGSNDRAARRRYGSPFCRVIRPTKITYGRALSTPSADSTDVPGSGAYSAVSIPL